MAHTIFDVQVRTIECRECGAPVATEIQGGQVKCEYCGSVNVVTNRKAASRAGEERSMADEVARLGRLKAQLENPLSGHAYDMERPPIGWSAGEVATSSGRQRASQEWNRARAGGTPNTPEEQRKLCWLALSLADVHRATREPLKARAVLETALGFLGDEGHRHLIRCRLASEALDESDLASAEGWLDECNPAPEVIELDSAYRLPLALLRVRQGDAAATLSIVGMQDGDVPMDGAFLNPLTLIRVHALEISGHQSQADKELWKAIERFGKEDVLPYLEAWGFAPATRHRAVQADFRTRLRSLVEERSKYSSGLLTAAGATLGSLPFIAMVLLIPIAASRCIGDTDPLMGVYGHGLCPHVCDGCRGPVRIATVWSHSSNSSSTNGAQYFCLHDRNGIEQMTQGQLESSARGLDYWELHWLAATGATYLIVLVLLLPFVPLLVIRRRLRDRRKVAALNQEITAIAQQLRQRPPPHRSKSLRGVAVALLFVGGSVIVALIIIAVGVY